MQALSHNGINAALTYSNSTYDPLLSSKITRCALSALTWIAGFGTSYTIVYSAHPFLSLGLWAGSAALSIMAIGFFLIHTSQENYINKVTLVAVSTFFYLGGFLACAFLYSSATSLTLAIGSVVALDVNLGLSALSWTLMTVGYVLPGMLKMHRMGIQVFSGIDTPINKLPSYMENFATWLPKHIRNLMLSNACLFIENEGFKSFLLRLEDYKITLEDLLNSMKTPDKIQMFWNKCQAFDTDANLIIVFCFTLEEQIDAVKDSAEAEKLMEMISRNAKKALDLSTLFSLLKQDSLVEKQVLLLEYYNQYLKNDGNNKYIAKLRTKLQKVEELDDDTPSYEVLGHLMSTEQCKLYLSQLNIGMENEGAIFTFQKELERYGLGTLGELKKAKLYPSGEKKEAQEVKLLNALLGNKSKGSSFLEAFKISLSQKNLSIQQTLSKVIFVVKRIFIEVTFWTLRFLSFVNNPWFFAAGFSYGLLFYNEVSQIAYLIPHSESILYTDDTFQGARHYYSAVL